MKAAQVSPLEKTSLGKEISELCKARLSSFVVLTALCGAAVAPGKLSLLEWIALILGTSGIVGSANAVNCYLERDVDALMTRTKKRPLVTGRFNPSRTLFYSLLAAALSEIVLFYGTNSLTGVLGFLGFLLYVAVYTPLKRHSMSALFAGAIPGAVPPMMGWAAVTGHLDLGAWILFGILFFWQLPHFIAISLHWQPDYERAGLKTVPGSMGIPNAQRQMIFYSGLLILTGLTPAMLGLAGLTYALTNVLIGLIFIGLCLAGFFRILHLNWNRLVFFGSLLYLPIVLGVWVVDQWIVRWTS